MMTRSQHLNVQHIMYLLMKLTRLHEAVIMMKYYRLLIKSYHIHMVGTLEKYTKQNC